MTLIMSQVDSVDVVMYRRLGGGSDTNHETVLLRAAWMYGEITIKKGVVRFSLFLFGKPVFPLSLDGHSSCVSMPFRWSVCKHFGSLQEMLLQLFCF